MASDQRAGPEIAVAVVDAETPGNVGSIARSMKNFGLSELLLVDPPELDPDGEAYGFAGQAREDILPNATELTFEQLAERYHTVACTATTNEDPANHVRYPAVTAADLPDHLAGVDGDVAVVFGRERVGLTNDELAALDVICSIPADDSYPVLNLAQAATIVFYELRQVTVERTQHPDQIHELAEKSEVERVQEYFGEYLDAVGHPEEKRAKTERMFRRVLGRAQLTPREARTLQGVFRDGTQRLDRASDERERREK
ncbi:TrmJ/YjtD family RNA methyltransferase [Halovenus sp. WSH3]|uniref:TrmJ/YjtD family RNA methyltransferase n=1 Tax=Halovenus carboxidivorans TaxID=2692199 RepID=A0A6B0T9P4_9EURY|nr:RNA methyltransferase [Halovenus carboxidivorans]MXR51590.1 TrmJ/YjtD family RNA methyltransferase [Halovenus carboxidivorans]